MKAVENLLDTQQDDGIAKIWIPNQLNSVHEVITPEDRKIVIDILEPFKDFECYDQIKTTALIFAKAELFSDLQNLDKRAFSLVFTSWVFELDNIIDATYTTDDDNLYAFGLKYLNECKSLLTSGEPNLEFLNVSEAENAEQVFESYKILIELRKWCLANMGFKLSIRWSKSVCRYLDGLILSEAPMMRRAFKAKKHLSDIEYRQFRWLSSSFGWVATFFLDEMGDHMDDVFVDHDTTLSIIAQYFGYLNDVISYEKETRGNVFAHANRVQKKLMEDDITDVDAFKIVVREANELMSVVLTTYEYLPHELQFMVNSAYRIVIQLTSCQLYLPRYRWKRLSNQ